MKISAAPYLIAEIGINHNGDIGKAKQLIKVAADCGADAVKFQKREPDICVPDSQKNVMRDTPWGEMTYLEYKKKLEFSLDEYLELKDLAKSLDLDFSASAWDFESLNFLNQIGLDFHKIASALITHYEFVQAVSKSKLPILASTGMTTWAELDKAVSILRGAPNEVILLHTVSTYPANEDTLNLQMIETLHRRFQLPVGYSGHESSVSPSIVAAALGAVIIERHFTLNRAEWGTDHAASLEPLGLRNLAGALKKLPVVLGDGEKKQIPGELEVSKKLRYW